MIHLMAVPEALQEAIVSKVAYVSGSMVKDSATNQVLAHLQPTGRMTQWVFDAARAGPLAPLELASSVVQNVQLLEIKGMLETLHTVASIGAAASVLNLGVSIGGFAMVLISLRRMERTLDKVFSTVKAIESIQSADYLGATMAAVERAESAFALSAAGDRRRYWQEADLELSQAIGIALKRLAIYGLELEPGNLPSTDDPGLARRLYAPEAMELLRLLLLLSSARVEVLLGLQMADEAARQCRRVCAWLSTLPFTAKDLARAQLGGRTMPSTQMTRVTSQANAIATLIRQAEAVSEERALLCQTLHEQGADTLEYALTVRNHPEATVLVLDHSGRFGVA